MSSSSGNSPLDAAIQQIDIAKYLETVLGLIRKAGSRSTKEFYTACLACGKDGKMAVSLKNGLWKCNACGQKGNLLTLTARVKWCESKKAAALIYEFAGMEPPKNGKSNGNGKGRTSAKVAAKPTPSIPASTRSQEIYQQFIDLTVLTDTDRQHLRKKRGFTDATIDTLRFRSGGDGGKVREAVDALRQVYSEADLLDSGILCKVNGLNLINDQLLDGRLLIPYLNEHGNVYHLRPHKLGFKGVAVQPYSRFLLKEKPDRVVLCEGEFKAVALWQVGIPALGIPGISSFGDKNYDRLVELLREFGVKAVTVIFDNEIKDDPSLGRFKARAEDRYDTQYWNYLMAYYLGRHDHFIARAGWLPDEWRGKDGKADWDSALAAGRTREEFLKVIESAVTPQEFLDRLPEEANRIVRHMLASRFTHVPVKRDSNRNVYIAQRTRSNGEKWDEPITNFVMNIKSNLETPEGRIRNVELINEFGERSRTFPMTPGEMAGLNEFKKFLFDKGNYIFKGRGQDDLTHIWEVEFLRDSGSVIYMPAQIGLLENGIWLFGNLAVKDGKIYRPDRDGVIWVDGKGYKPQSQQMGSRGEPVEDAIPALAERDLDITEVARHFYKAVGGYEAYMGLGWVAATIFSQDIFDQLKCFPILFPHGKRESGKSTFMRWIMAFFGSENDGVGISESTQNYIARALSYYSSLGVWFDEYRNEPKVTQKDGFFRSAYNRQLSGKGTATTFQTRGFAVHAAVAISGEELPKDNGLFTRIIPLQMSVYRRNAEAFEWMNRNRHRFSNFTLQLIMRYDKLKDRLLENIADLKKALAGRGISDRTAENWAICAAAFELTVFEDDQFIDWVEVACQEIKQVGEQEHMLNQFWKDVNVLVSKNEVNHRHLRVEGDKMYVWFSGVFGAWSPYYRMKTGKEPFDELSITKYLREEPYCIGYNSPKKLAGHTRKVYTILIPQATETVQEIASYIFTTQSQSSDQVAADSDDF